MTHADPTTRPVQASTFAERRMRRSVRPHTSPIAQSTAQLIPSVGQVSRIALRRCAGPTASNTSETFCHASAVAAPTTPRANSDRTRRGTTAR